MDIKRIIENIKNHREVLTHDKVVFEILEGELTKYLRSALNVSMTASSSDMAMHRAAPVNILKKIVSKLSTLYSVAPIRITENSQDQELIDWYIQNADINSYWQDANTAFNAHKKFALELYEHEGMLKTRALAPSTFIAHSDSEVDPLEVTEFIKILPHKDNEVKYWIYSKEEFHACNAEGVLIPEDMENNEGVNPYGIIPISYQTRSRYLLTPRVDSDLIKMTLLIPILLTDLNFASMFLSNPIIWTMNADGADLRINPNTYLDLKGTDPEQKPEIGVLKPEPNIEAQLTLIKDTIGLWLQSRNIKSSAIGRLTADSASSGIALAIQEMDTSDDRKLQMGYFKDAEHDFWKRLATMHNELAKSGTITNRKLFSDPSKLEVSVSYSEQTVPETKHEQLERIGKQLDLGLISKRSALKELHADIQDKEIDTILEEIKAERETFVIDGDQGYNDQNFDTEGL